MLTNNVSPVRPEKAYEIVTFHISTDEATTTSLIAKNNKLTFDKNISNKNFYLIIKGYFSIFRANDNLLLLSGHAPALFGVAEFFSPQNAYYIVTDTECETLVIPAIEAVSLFSKKKIWIHICEIQIYFIQMLQSRDIQLIGVDAYTIIRNKIIELNSLSIEEKEMYSVLPYIQNRSNLSRSLIAKILSSLRTGGYISMQKGKLVGIKSLPKKY